MSRHFRFNSKQKSFLKECYVARIATVSKAGSPRVTPIYFANDLTSVFFATERSSMKFKDLTRNPKVALVMDYFDAGWLHDSKLKKNTSTIEKAVVIRGNANIYDDGEVNEYKNMYNLLFKKYPDYREQGWKRGESPIIKILPNSISDWGL